MKKNRIIALATDTPQVEIEAELARYPLPGELDQKIHRWVTSHWGVEEERTTEKEDVHSKGSISSLSEWRRLNRGEGSSGEVVLSWGRLRSDESHPLLKAMGVPQEESENACLYPVGARIVLDIQNFEQDNFYITVLLKRGEDPIRLAYPYDQSDEYKPMRRLELEWEVEAGPTTRSFIVLRSRTPLLDPAQLEETQEGGWRLEHDTQAVRSIDWGHVVDVEEIHWRTQL